MTIRNLVLISKHFRPTALLPIFLIVTVIVLAGCASGAGNPASSRDNSVSRILACKSTDRQVASEGQCLLDDAACYQISNGQWCTGPRGNVCPAGSFALGAGEACPAGSRCFTVGESLQCRI